jgi:hypothetical protein
VSEITDGGAARAAIVGKLLGGLNRILEKTRDQEDVWWMDGGFWAGYNSKPNDHEVGGGFGIRPGSSIIRIVYETDSGCGAEAFGL